MTVRSLGWGNEGGGETSIPVLGRVDLNRLLEKLGWKDGVLFTVRRIGLCSVC